MEIHDLAPKRILQPFDFSDPSKNALEIAAGMSRQFDAELLVVYAVEDYIFPVDLGDVDSYFRELCQKAARELEEVIAPELPEDIRIRTSAKIGKPHKIITETAEAERADLIVIPTHGYGRVKHAVLGSTAERVVRHAKCPVLVLPHR